MSNIIDKIRVSGTDYTLSATSSGGNPTIEVTQAEYDALVSAGTVQEDTYYIITDSSIDYINSAQCQSQIDSSISGKADTSAVTEAIDAAVSGKVSTNDFNAYSGSVNTTLNSKASQSDLNSLSGTVTGHTANTAIHVTSSEKTTWSGKQDALVSGTNIKTINNESILGSGNITIQSEVSSAITSGDTNAVAGGAIYDKFDEVEQVTAAALNDINDRVSEDEEVTAAALNSLNTNKQDKLSAGTGIEISGNVISATGGGGGNPTVELTQAEYDALVSAGTVSADTYYIITDATPVDMSNYYTTAQTNTLLGGKQDTLSAGRGISISSNTVDFTLPISAGTGMGSIVEGLATIASGESSHAEGYYTVAAGQYSHAEGGSSRAFGDYSHAEGRNTIASGESSHAEGGWAKANEYYSHAEGRYTIANNIAEHASGQYNVSSSASTTFGHSGNTLFSVGNGTSTSARHNAFEIRQNGDIYLSSGGTDIKLQDHLGGGTVSSAITRGDTNAVAGGAVYDKFDEVEQVTAQALNALNESLSGKQDTLVSGTNIKTINNESILGSGNINIQGGGKAIAAGRGISVTTGETADTVSFNLPFYSNSDSDIICGDESSHVFSGKHNNNFITGNGHFIKGASFASGKVSYSSFFGMDNTIQNTRNTTQLNFSAVFGRSNYILNASCAFASGTDNQVNNDYEFDSGRYNVSSSASTSFGNSGNTLFSVGNGRDIARHNAFEIRQNGDIYIADTNNTSTSNYYEKPMIKLQDQLGGGGASYSAGTGIDITNDVISVTGMVETSAITTSITSSSTDTQVPSAKAVYDAIPVVTNTITSGSTDAVTAGAVYDAIGDIETLLSQI